MDSFNVKNNTLSIRLTESAVYLSTDQAPEDRSVEQRSTLLRGLLILHLAKPTKITSIEAELTATSSLSWPEDIGARRIEIHEEHRLFHASTLYFHANKSHSRRTASIGPGVHYNNTYYDDDWDTSSYSNETPIHTTSSLARPPIDASTGNTNNEIHPSINTQTQHFPRIFPPPFFNQRRNRRMSSDGFHFPSTAMSLRESDESLLHIQQSAPIPPYSPFTPPPSDLSHLSTVVNENLDPGLLSHPSPSFEDSRHSLYTSLRSGQNRTTSHERVIPEDDTIESGLDTNTSMSLMPTVPNLPILTSTPPYASFPLDSHSPTSPVTPQRWKRFSLSAVPHVFIDAVLQSSPRTSHFGRSREREYGRDRERSVETTTRHHRGRTMERAREGCVNLNGGELENDLRHAKDKGRGIIAMMLGEKEKPSAEGWKEFKQGTYTFPISFSIPGDAPPTMVCDYGSVSWRLRASVHRPGTFKSKMTATREVITVACPTAEDTEHLENIIVERHWEQQLQYLIVVSGRSFYVGGTIPVTFTFMPLAKINIHRLSVFMEERVDYYTNKRIARTDPIARFNLLSIKGDDNYPILPLQSDDPDALRQSPLFALIDPRDDLSEVASNLMGPGPWMLHQDLKLPDSCSQMKFTNKNHKSNIVVTHTLKLVIRVERGDDSTIDGKTGKKKLFDIVVQTPVLILSCRCNSEWICLPQYSEVFDGSTAIVPSCPCRTKHPYPNHTLNPIEATTSRGSSDSCVSPVETSSVNVSLSMASLRQLHFNEAILSSNSLFERLVSGQESVSGEVPPAYDVAGSQLATNGVAVL